MAINWFSPVPPASSETRLAMALEAQRRGWWFGWAGPAGFAAAAGVAAGMNALGVADEVRASAAGMAVFLATVGVIAGIIGGSAMHSVAGLYAGMAAGAVTFVVGSAARLIQGDGTSAIALGVSVVLRFGGMLGSFATFGSLFAWADRQPGRMRQGAKAALMWLFSMMLAGMVAVVVGAVAGGVLGGLLGLIYGPLGQAVAIAVCVAALLFAVRYATGRFFLDVRGWYDPMVRRLRAARKKRARDLRARLRGEKEAPERNERAGESDADEDSK